MKGMWKRKVALCMCMALLVGLLPIIEISTGDSLGIVNEAEASSSVLSLSELKAKFPHGKYWNHAGNPGSSNSVNNQDGYTSTPCSKHGVVGTDEQTCNGFAPSGTQLSWQCMGFAEKLGYDSTGYNPRVNANGWSTSSNSSALSSLKAGDIVCYKNGGHTIFVTAVNGDTVTYADCNSDDQCVIRWDQTISKNTLRSTFYFLRSAPNELGGGASTSFTVNSAYPVPISAYPAATSGKITVYDANLNAYSTSSRYISYNDKCTIQAVYTNGYCKVKYPSSASSSGYAEAYAKTSDFIPASSAVTPYSYSPSENKPSYTRSDMSTSFGTVYTTDSCTVVGKSGSLLQLIYPLDSGGYKMGWIIDESASASGSNPVGSFDGAAGGVQSFTIRGWAYDPDLWSKHLDIHVYVGGPAGSGAGCVPIVANAYRPDVETVYGDVGAYHGFSATIETTLTGNVDIYVYAINVEGGTDNTLLGCKTVTITADTEAPQILEKSVSNVTKNGYTVSVTATDNTGIKEAVFYTWTEENGQDDLVVVSSTDGSKVAQNSDTYTYYVDVSGHNQEEGTYHTHVYVWDKYGNHSVASVSTEIDRTKPFIESYEVVGITPNGYTVKCKVSDNTEVDRVLFPTWTEKNGQDDLSDNWKTDNSCLGTRDGDEFYFVVKTSDHNNETGAYKTHIYAYDVYGNWTSFEDNETEVIIVPEAQYTVSYNANGGTGVPASQTKNHGTDLTLSSTVPTRTGYTFNGWNTKSDGTGTSYAAGATYTANANITLYAQWKAKTYIVSYNANGGTGAPSNQTKIYGTALTLSTTAPTRTGYTFNGWNTKADGTGTSYAAGATYTANANITLYAQWTKKGDIVESDYQLWLEGSTARLGGQLAVPVYLDGVSLGSLTMTIQYDSTKLKYIGESDSAFEMVLVNDTTDGILKIVAINETKGSTGKLLVLNFEVIADAASETSISVSVTESTDEQENKVQLAAKGVVIAISSFLLGDVNGDGEVTAIDARWVLQAAAGNRDLGGYWRAGDVNGDGEITAIDARWILQAAAGKRMLQ